MRKIAAEAQVAAPVERVWALYTDMERTPEWVPFVEEVLETSGPVEVGMVYRERTRLAGLTSVDEWRVAALETHRRRVDVAGGKGMDSLLVVTMEPEEGGTKLRQEVHLRSRLPWPLSRVHEAVFARIAQRGIDGAVKGAKRHLEKHSPKR